MTTITIDRLSNKGFGMATLHDGTNIMVPGTIPGEKVEISISNRTHANERYRYGTIKQILIPSPSRVDPFCQHSHICGGCPWMIMDYHKQLEFKKEKLIHYLDRVGISYSPSPVVASPKIRGYRNRAQLKSDGSKVGYIQPGTKEIHGICECPILNKKCQATLQSIIQQLPNEKWKPTPPHTWNFIEIDDQIDEICVNHRLPFKQGNTKQNLELKKQLKTILEQMSCSGPIVEFFSGSGNLTEIICSKNEVTTFEVCNCKNPFSSNEITCNLYSKYALKMHKLLISQAKVLIADPPRDGLKNKRYLLPMTESLEHIVLISCSLDSMSHDLRYLIKKGFKLEKIVPIDFFPHTPHLEVLTWLKRLP